MAKKTKKKRFSLVAPSHKDTKASAEIKLLHTRALLALRNFTHYDGGDQARALMERLFLDYKKYPEELHKRLQEACSHVTETNTNEKIREKLKEAISEINLIAKKTGVAALWKQMKKKKKVLATL